MKNQANRLLNVDTHDSLVRVLQSWRLWIIGAIAGALIASGVYALFPSAYRAKAVVVVDHNLEQFLDIPPEDHFYFLGRETRKLQALAWSDETLQMVADAVGELSVRQLRDEVLSLSQPQDGGWDFFAESRDSQRAGQIAGAWAQSFYQQVYDAVENSAAWEQYRVEVEALFREYPGMSGSEISSLAEQQVPEYNQIKGISPYIELSLAQVEDLPVARKTSAAVYLLAGSVIGACSMAFAVLFWQRAEEEDAFLVE
jgi:hypothetical protein